MYAKKFPLGLSNTYKPTTDALRGRRHRRILLRLRAYDAAERPEVRRYLGDPPAPALRGRPDDQDLVRSPGTGGGAAGRRHDRASGRTHRDGRRRDADPAPARCSRWRSTEPTADTSDHLPVFNQDPKTRKIIESKDRVHTKFNYATAPAFQAGSTFKLFTLAAALEKGLSTSTTFNSPACVYLANFPYGNPLNPGANCISDTPGVIAPPGVGYANAGDSEACTCNMINATSGSVNTYFVQLEKKVGVPEVRDMAIRLGVQSPALKGPRRSRRLADARIPRGQPAGHGDRVRHGRGPGLALLSRSRCCR